MRCLNCFNKYDESFGLCPKCGVDHVEKINPNDLEPGTNLNNRYTVGQSIGNGGFGIVYKAWDERLHSVVAIKEFFPKQIVNRNIDTGAISILTGNEDEFYYRKNRFIAEDKITAEFRAHKNIVTEYDCFEANNTVYMVMEYFTGDSLASLLEKGERFTEKEALQIIYEVADALSAIHNIGVIHRDVSPDNIFIIREPEFRVILLDFGAAKLVDYVAPVTDILLKTGYSPLEQYKDMDSTNYSSDVYSLAATLYRILTNVEPLDALKREETDDLKDPDTINSEISSSLNNTIMNGLKLDSSERISSIDEFVSELQMKPINKVKVSGNNTENSQKKKLILSIASAAGVVIALLVFFYFFSPRTASWLCNHKYENNFCSRCKTFLVDKDATKNIVRIDPKIESKNGETYTISVDISNKSGKQIEYMDFYINFFDGNGKTIRCEKNKISELIKPHGKKNVKYDIVVKDTNFKVINSCKIYILYSDGSDAWIEDYV